MPFLTFANSFPGLLPHWNTISDLLLAKWTLLVLLCLALIITTTLSHRRERKYYQRLVSHATNADTVTLDYGLKLLSRSARNYFLFSISFIVLLFCVVFYDIKQHHVLEVATLQEDMQNCREEQLSVSPAPAAQPENVAPVGPALSDILPPRSLKQDEEAELDALKRRYEKAYVNFYLLYHCGQAPVADLSLLEASLSLEAAPFGQAAEFLPLVRQASVGTYQELYQGFRCDSPDLQTAADSHRRQLDAARENLQVHSQAAAPAAASDAAEDPKTTDTAAPTADAPAAPSPSSPTSVKPR